ncbi:hypothetical protein D3C71_1590680 [compost metagenome]
MLLPAPGGPTISKLWPPAAATSRARRAPGCPRTSDRQGIGAASGQGLGSASGSMQTPAAWAATSARLRADSTRKPGTQAACSALPAGRISVASGASRATPNAMTSGAATGTRAPVKDSSPARTS